MKLTKRIKWTLAALTFLIVLHMALPFVLVWYVNKTLDDIPGYKGSVSWIHVNLFRGAYQIHDLELLIEAEETYEPFFAAEAIDLSVEWSALFDGKIVGEIVFEEPRLVFIPPVETKEEETIKGQTGSDVDWTKPVKELMPLRINRMEIVDGIIHYKDISFDPAIDVYVENLDALATNLSNAETQTDDLPSDLKITAQSIGGGVLDITGKLNIIKQTPDFDIDLSFEEIDITALNDFADAYAKVDFEKGRLNFYGEFAGRDGDFKGYIKPIMNNLKFVSFKKDKKQPLKLIWEALVGTLTEIFENQGENQFATRVPLKGSYKEINPDIWKSVGSVLENAFIDAFKNKTDDTIDLEENKE